MAYLDRPDYFRSLFSLTDPQPVWMKLIHQNAHTSSESDLDLILIVRAFHSFSSTFQVQWNNIDLDDTDDICMRYLNMIDFNGNAFYKLKI